MFFYYSTLTPEQDVTTYEDLLEFYQVYTKTAALIPNKPNQADSAWFQQ
jgi:hypothetical protein